MKFLCLVLLFLTHAFASDSSSISSKSGKTPTVRNTIFNLKTLEDIQKQAAEDIKALLTSIIKVPNPILGGNEGILNEISEAARFARRAKSYLPVGSKCRQKMHNVYVSAKSSRELLENPLRKMSCKSKKINPYDNHNGRPRVYYTCVSRRNQAVKDILEALQSVNLTQSSYGWLMKFSTFVIDFAKQFNLLSEDILLDFSTTMRALRKRKKMLDVLDVEIDWKNIDRYYASYSQSLYELLGRIDFTPKGTKVNELSHAVHVLARALKAYAKLSSNNEDIFDQIQLIADQEEKTSRLYRTWKMINNIHEVPSEKKISREFSNS